MIEALLKRVQFAEYKVVCKIDRESLEHGVNAYLKHGYIPWGSPSLTMLGPEQREARWVQAVVKLRAN